ncbi:MAG: alpha-amylase [Bacilli bacterium]|nr:alpha-amylase [Bacilli bacterium]
MKQNEIIYQIFPRNYSKEGTFKQITKDLERIRDLGVNIIYLMPIHEIGVKNRKGTYGSPYAIKDYYSISKDLGRLTDFKKLVKETHRFGMKIILDMVFNHTAPDNVLLKNHEDYYYHKNGKLGNRVGDWSDIVDLDTYKKETQDYLLDVLKYWVSLGVDGFRFDVASMIPLSFFKRAREELKDIIFIGESIDFNFHDYLVSIGDKPTNDDDMFPTFDSLYNYNFFHELFGYFKNKNGLDIIVKRLSQDQANLRLLCLENHDTERIVNQVNKLGLERLLDFYSFIKGQLFIYAGQEYGNDHKPELFEKDPVDFSYKNEEIAMLYRKCIADKKAQKEIISSNYALVDKYSIKVVNLYVDGTKEERIFNLNLN